MYSYKLIMIIKFSTIHQTVNHPKAFEGARDGGPGMPSAVDAHPNRRDLHPYCPLDTLKV